MAANKRGTSVIFDQPIEVRLANHPRRFRVHGVTRSKNPNGIPGLFSYAIAEWYFAAKWRRVSDLVQQTRLANTVKHELGRNKDAYANVDGDNVIGEMRFNYRILYHTPSGKTYVRYPIAADDDNPRDLERQLEQLVEDGKATGGDIEQFVDGIGWCIQTPEQDDDNKSSLMSPSTTTSPN